MPRPARSAPTLAVPVIATALLVAMASPSLAHPGHGGHDSLMAGFEHPFSGVDHILAMVTVGLWAALLGGRAIWQLPAAFLATMAAGYGLALAGAHLPLVEPAILASVVVLGLLVAIAARVPAAVGVALVAFFAIFHGNAHGTELGGATPLGYGAGFLVATLLLHVAGALAGIFLQRQLGAMTGGAIGRLAGAAMAVGGLVMIFVR